MPVPERSRHCCFKVANPIYFIVHTDINVLISGLMPRGRVGILTLRSNCCVSVCVCVCARACVCVRAGHRWQHLRLSVRLSSVETEAHQAVLTCNSDELCKSSMKLNLRLGPQHTHTHTDIHTHTLSPLMAALITHGPGCMRVCVCLCVCVCVCLLCAPRSHTFIKGLCSLRLYVYKVWRIVAMIHIWFKSVTCGPVADS